MINVKKTIAQMKTPLDRALEEISTGALNPRDIEKLCVRYNNPRFLRTFNNTHKDCLCAAVHSGSISMVKWILNQSCYDILRGDDFLETEHAIHAATRVGRQDMFELLLDRGGDRVDRSQILIRTVRYNMPHLFKLLPISVNYNVLWDCALTHNADKIKPLLPELTFEWFVYSLPINTDTLDQILSTRPDFTTHEQLQKIANRILATSLQDPSSDHLNVMVKHGMMQWIVNAVCTHKYVLKWTLNNYPEYITRRTIEACLLHYNFDQLEELCKYITVDFELILCAINNSAPTNALKTLVHAMQRQSLQ
tara:strand:+ start:12412 stop:13335 length:924 start_codon:yes stop_codon:yes gene_type:complete